MNVVNRIIMTLAALAIFAFGSITFLLLTGIVVPANQYLRAILALYAAYRAVALLRGASANTAILIALLVGLIGLVFLVLEVAPLGRLFRRREGKPYVVRHDNLGEVSVQRSMVSDLVQHETEATPGVIHAEPEVKDGPNGLRVGVRAQLAWDADAPSVGQALQERIKDSVQTHLGLPIAEVRVTTQAAPPLRESRRRVA
jgi:uncharacterized alkaline shock family protein YloU